MKEIRLNLTAAEIRAYQAGDRVLRRKVKPQPGKMHDYGNGTALGGALSTCGIGDVYSSPFGSPGDTLVLLEKWLKCTGCYDGNGVIFAADCDHVPAHKWKSAACMPRELARYTPTVRTVTVEKIDGVWWWVCELEG